MEGFLLFIAVTNALCLLGCRCVYVSVHVYARVCVCVRARVCVSFPRPHNSQLQYIYSMLVELTICCSLILSSCCLLPVSVGNCCSSRLPARHLSRSPSPTMPDAGTCVFVTALCYALTRPLPSPCTHLWGQALALPGPAGQGNVGGDSEVGSVRVCVLVNCSIGAVVK